MSNIKITINTQVLTFSHLDFIWHLSRLGGMKFKLLLVIYHKTAFFQVRIFKVNVLTNRYTNKLILNFIYFKIINLVMSKVLWKTRIKYETTENTHTAGRENIFRHGPIRLWRKYQWVKGNSILSALCALWLNFDKTINFIKI